MTFTSSLGNGLAKATGYVGLAAIAYDAHKLGQLRSGESRRCAIADDALDSYQDTRQMDSISALTNLVQDKRRSMEMNGQFFNGPKNFFKSVTGYVKGIAESLVTNVIPLALTAATVLTKGTVSKISAAGLAIYGGCNVAKNAFGIGNQGQRYLK